MLTEPTLLSNPPHIIRLLVLMQKGKRIEWNLILECDHPAIFVYDTQ